MTNNNGTQRAGVAGWAAWRRLAVVAVLAVAGFAPGAARAEDPYETSFSPSPNVLLLLDTSGSMEYLRQEHKVPCCIQGDPLCNDPTKRTRWMMVQDALLGPVTNDTYKCLRFWAGDCVKQDMFEDCSDPAIGSQRFWIPDGVTVPGQRWVIPQYQEYGTRNVTYGILERYRERVRFGAAFLDSYYSPQTDVDGMFSYLNSYGEPYLWHGQSINVGIRGRETPASPVFGALTTWGGDDTDINVLNLAVRKEIGESFRYCGSPISAALQDIRHYFATDVNNQPPPGGTDRFATCRQRAVVLITDGMPNSGEGNPYSTSAVAAGALWSAFTMRVPLYVIGFSLCPGTTSEGANVRATLNEIACEGCPTGEPNCLSPCRMLEANSTDELIAALDQVLFSTSSSGVTSRTLAITTNQVSANDPATVVQYQFNTGVLPSGSNPWEGVLERTAYVCDSATGKVVPGNLSLYTDFGAQLDLRTSPRELKTVTTPAAGPREPPFTAAVDLESFDTTNGDLDAAELGCQGAECTDGVFVPNTVNYIHGRAGTARAGRRLADIYHASVAVVGRPNMEIPIVSYYRFQEDKWARTQALYAATNDGVLHAFRANNTTSSSQTGEELWGYVPNYLLPKVHEQVAGGHITNLDSTPTTRDLRIFKGASTTAASDDWRTILVGGYRQGGRGYYALDVTDPATPKLLWEINNETDDSSTVADPADYANLWLTYASPFLGTAFIPNRDLSGGPELGELSVTIFPGGFNPTDPVTTTTDLYVVSTKTGRLIRKLTPRFPSQYACAGDCNAKPECCAQLITSPVGYGAIPGLVTSRVFVGDDRGRIWRADLAASDPTEWSLDLFYPHPLPPTGEPSPAYRIASDVKFPPALALDKENRLVVIFGTGDVDDTGRLDENYVVSVTEHIEFDATASKYVGRAYHNWTLCPNSVSNTTCLDLGSIIDPANSAMRPGEKLTGVPIVFNQTAYFSTFVPLADPANACEMGEGRIWGVKYNYLDTSSADDLLDWQNLRTSGDITTDPILFVPYPQTYIAGITILQRPSCYDATAGSPPLPGLGSSSRETFELVAQVSKEQPGSTQPEYQQVPTVSITIPTPPIINYADSWGSVFE
jgi:type IV pilus assembly protein PilY1